METKSIVLTLMQSSGNETNQAQAPEIPPASGTVQAAV